MAQRQVKGTMILDYVKMIKKYKVLDWNKYLRPEDWELVESTILPSQWYPFDFYRRSSQAAFQLIGGGSLEKAHADGRRMAHRMFETVYMSVIQRKDAGGSEPFC
jgi:hypothetical protein